MQIEAVLERETLPGEPARLRPRPACLRAAREGVERGAPEAGIVETVGYRQAAPSAKYNSSRTLMDAATSATMKVTCTTWR